MNKLRILLAALAVTAFNGLWGWFTCGWLFNWVYELPPVTIWRAPQDMTALFWTIDVIVTIALAFIFVLVLRWIARGLPGRRLVKGLSFGLVVWLVGILPGVFATALFMDVNIVYPIYMGINQLIALPLAGLIAAAIALPGTPAE